jgi:hypothetical protein
LINTQKLCALVTWAEKSTDGVKSKVNPLARRNLALVLVIANARINTNNIAYASAFASFDSNSDVYYADVYTYSDVYAYANVYSTATTVYTNINAINQSINLIYSLAELQIFDRLDYKDIETKIRILKKQIPNDNQSKQVYQEFSKNIVQVWCQFLKIELNWLDLSRSEIENLLKYFTANLLIMQCKEAAVFIPANGWAQI